MINDFGFEWDDEKAQANLRKHGVSFSEAASVFAEWGAPTSADPEHSDEEDRFIIVGTSDRPTTARRRLHISGSGRHGSDHQRARCDAA